MNSYSAEMPKTPEDKDSQDLRNERSKALMARLDRQERGRIAPLNNEAFNATIQIRCDHELRAKIYGNADDPADWIRQVLSKAVEAEHWT